MKRPLRIWMTGCVAVVSLALFNPRDPRTETADMEQGDTQRSAWRTSQVGMNETIHRLESAAQAQGLAVFARFTEPARAPGRGRAASTVLVFAATNGATPVVMDGDQARPALPLSLVVRERADGRAEVMLPSTPLPPQDAWPADVAGEMGRLPQVLASALAT